ncbi:MAG: ferrous iron transporter B, partial [Eubacterium sp.]|nr:ferrous iron transporter B [Eubacterium sp.]
LVEKNGDKINTKALSDKLGVPVLEISAMKGTGIDQVTEKAIELAKAGRAAERKHSFSKEVEDYIQRVEEKLPSGIKAEERRFFAIKLLERDDKVAEMAEGLPDVSAEIAEMEKAFDDDTESIITNERYNYISSIISGVLKKKHTGTKMNTSDKIDRIVTNRWLALPIFAVIMFIVYYVSISTLGGWATDWTNDNLFGDGFHLFGMSGDFDADTEKWAEEHVFVDEVKAVIDQAAEDKNVIGAEDLKGAFEDGDLDGFTEAYGTYADDLIEKGYAIDEVLEASGALNEEGEFDSPDPSEYGTWVPSIPALAEKGLDAMNCAEWLKSLILDGIIAGVGAVLGFVPQMLVLFIFLAILEECGYMARVAFIMDRIFRKFGLSGKSFIPVLIGTGCGVPGIMASRTIENERDRRMTIMTTTFIPCGAKLPIISLIAAALFHGSAWVAWSAYFIGVAAIVLSGIILKKTKIFAGDPAPFVMELPAYHAPKVGAVLRSMWERGWSFIKKAGTIILLSSILIWAGKSFGWVDGAFGFNPDVALEDSILGKIGSGISWIFAPLGFDNIRATVATVMGLVAKEEVVGVFGVLDFEGLTRLAGYSFLLFNLLCAPCFAAIGAIKREMNSAKWTWFAIGYQCAFAYVVSLCVYQIGMLFTGTFSAWVIVAFLLLIGFAYLLFRPYKESQKLEIKMKKSA